MRYDTPLRSEHEKATAAARSFTPVTGSERSGASGNEPVGASGNEPVGASGFRPPPRAIEWIPYGPTAAGGEPLCEIVAAYGPVELEYASLRRAAGIVDAPQRGTIRVRGADRRDFLGRMVTQDLRTFDDGRATAGFWLNRKGRIEADLFLVAHRGEILVDLDVHQTDSTLATLAPYIVVEDVELVDDTAAMHRIVLHGPQASAVVARASGSAFTLERGAAVEIIIAGHAVIAARRDEIGDPGVHLFVPRAAAPAIWRSLLDRGIGDGLALRPVGWHAFNIARIEAGTPLMNVDFDTTCLPHESGVLRDRVSFTKGCYLGQEIVARMESLGRPKRMLVGLRIAEDLLPESGGNVHAVLSEGGDDEARLGEIVGTITSSAPSPMLGSAPIAFAMVRSSHAAAETRLLVTAENRRSVATVGPLRMWGRA